MNVSAPRAPQAPRRAAAASGAAEGSTSGMRGVLKGLAIVIVDDDPDARDLLSTVLTQRDAQVYVADCAAGAFDLLVAHRPDVLISDIAMPEEDGYMLIGRVRALPPDGGGATPAIALTAYAGSADRKRAVEAGFDAHFAKPLDIDGLIDRLLDMRSARDLRNSSAKTAK